MDFIRDTGEYDGIDVYQMDTYLSTYLSNELSNYFKKLFRDYKNGKINFLDFQRNIAKAAQINWVAALRIGAGGINNITSSDYGLIGSMLRLEYSWLRRLMQQFENGDVSELQFLNRLNKYALAPRRAYYAGVTSAKRRAGFTLEQRLLLEGLKHCNECIEYAEKGKVAIGTLPEPGRSCSCNSSCACVKVYYRE